MTSRFKYVAVATTLVTSLYATNGDNLVGLGAKALGMGGTGMAHYNGSESATSNPALIAKGKGTHITFGGTYFTPDVKVKTSDTGGFNDLTSTSDAKHNVIPFITLTENLTNGFAVGASMYGSAGMGTDWRSGNGTIGDPAAHDIGLYSMSSSLMLMKFSLPVAYGQDNWSVGVAPVIMYGALGIAFQTGGTIADTHDIGRGSSNDLGLGYEAGVAYTLKDMGVTLAARYQSPIMMEYKNQISVAGAAFGYGAGGVFAAKYDKLEQPAEIGVGLDWTQGDISLTADFKQIKWADAAGYGDFGWENQNVYAIGAEYRIDKLALRAGYNYGKNPIQNNTDSTPVFTGGPTNGDVMNAFNHVMFPAVTERHYTLGTGYQFTKNVGADLALMYATSPKVTVGASSVGLGQLTVQNNQKAVAANLNYKF
ncbi:MAG: outer membrane protein transport protein [Sulfuricurvum sp.]|nr:outer membrane protein transport protein [Sulfuricurvum sp.]